MSESQGEKQVVTGVMMSVTAGENENQITTSASSMNTNTDDDAVDETTVKLNLFLGKVIYFLTFAGFAFTMPFYSLFLHSRGFAPSIIGLIVAINPLACVTVVPPLLTRSTSTCRLLFSVSLLAGRLCCSERWGRTTSPENTPAKTSEAASPSNLRTTSRPSSLPRLASRWSRSSVPPPHLLLITIRCR